MIPAQNDAAQLFFDFLHYLLQYIPLLVLLITVIGSYFKITTRVSSIQDDIKGMKEEFREKFGNGETGIYARKSELQWRVDQFERDYDYFKEITSDHEKRIQRLEKRR